MRGRSPERQWLENRAKRAGLSGEAFRRRMATPVFKREGRAHGGKKKTAAVHGAEHKRLPRFHKAMALFAQVYWLEMLAECDGSVAEAARRGGTNRTNVYKLLNRYRVPHKSNAHTGDWRGL